jgi:hypothetical protein
VCSRASLNSLEENKISCLCKGSNSRWRSTYQTHNIEYTIVALLDEIHSAHTEWTERYYSSVEEQFTVCAQCSVHYNANLKHIYTILVGNLSSETLHPRSLERAKTEKKSFTPAIIIKRLYQDLLCAWCNSYQLNQPIKIQKHHMIFGSQNGCCKRTQFLHMNICFPLRYADVLCSPKLITSNIKSCTYYT